MDDFAPGDVAVAFDYGMGCPAFEGFLGEEGGMDAAVDDPGSALSSDAAYFVAAKSVAGVDADADEVAGLDGFGEDLLDGFIDEDGVAGCGWGSGGEDEKPTWSDDGGTEGVVAGVDEMNADESTLFLVRVRWIQRMAFSNVRETLRAGMIRDHDYSRRALCRPSYRGKA